eukprot:2605501-Rhodomonas_salina.2
MRYAPRFRAERAAGPALPPPLASGAAAARASPPPPAPTPFFPILFSVYQHTIGQYRTRRSTAIARYGACPRSVPDMP